MSRYTCNIVEVCRVDDPRAKILVETQKDLGFRVHRYRGAYLIIMVTDRVAGEGQLEIMEDGYYAFRDGNTLIKCTNKEDL